jgi:hypothetical protein
LLTLEPANKPDIFIGVRNVVHITNGENAMKKIIYAAMFASVLVSAPAFAKSQGLAANAVVLTGKGGVLGLLDGRGALVVNTKVTTGKNGVLGAVLGKGVLGGLLGGGCGCGY